MIASSSLLIASLFAGIVPTLAARSAAAATTSLIETVAGDGTYGRPTLPATATSMPMEVPAGVAVDAAGDLFVSDSGDCTVDKIASGRATLYAGTSGSCTDTGDGGPAISATLVYPAGLAVDTEGDLFIGTSSGCTVREVSVSTGDISTVAGDGTCGGTEPALPAAATSVELSGPEGLAVDSSGDLFIADTSNCAVWEVASGMATVVAGTVATCGNLGVGGPATSAVLGRVAAVAVGTTDTLYIADPDSCVIWEVASGTLEDEAGISTGLGCNPPLGDGGLATQARIGAVTGVAVDAAGDVYSVAQDDCDVREIFPSGYITTFAGAYSSAGHPLCGYNGDGISPTSALLYNPSQIATDASGDVFLADRFNERVREINSSAPAVTSLSPSSGWVGGGTDVTIEGSGFSWTTGVMFGSEAATSFEVISPTEIVAVSPALPVGTVAVTVSGLGGTSPSTGSGQFTVTAVPPTSTTSTSPTTSTSTSTPTSTTTSEATTSTSAASTSVPTSTTATTRPTTVTTVTAPGSTSTTLLPPGGSAGGSGLWMATATGGVYTFGAAGFYGSAAGMSLREPVVGLASTPDRRGYWLVASDGGIFTYGDARFFGSAGDVHLRAPVVGMAATPDGGGYWLVASDGGIFTYGDAGMFGSTGNLSLTHPVVGMAATPDGMGYWLVASDGGVFSFGNAGYFGSTGSLALPDPVVSLVVAPGGQGYWEVGAGGEIYPFGSAAGLTGSAGGTNAAVKAGG